MSRKQPHAKTYTCQHCRGVFEETVSEAAANEEALELASRLASATPQSSMARICDDCFQEFMKWHRERAFEVGAGEG